MRMGKHHVAYETNQSAAPLLKLCKMPVRVLGTILSDILPRIVHCQNRQQAIFPTVKNHTNNNTLLSTVKSRNQHIIAQRHLAEINIPRIRSWLLNALFQLSNSPVCVGMTCYNYVTKGRHNNDVKWRIRTTSMSEMRTCHWCSFAGVMMFEIPRNYSHTYVPSSS